MPAARAVEAPAPREACRVCGGSRLRDVGSVAGYGFVECPACGFTFTPQVRAETLAALYRTGWHGADDGAPSHGWADASFLEPALVRLDADPRGRGDETPRSLTILDFGTGQSRVPEILRRQGHRVVAVDVASPRQPHPDRLTGELRALALPPASFDLAYAFQVFEHLPDPRPHLLEMLRLTRPRGLVLVHTDMQTPERRAGFTRWWYVLPPDHCAFYRHRTFIRMLAGTTHRIVRRDAKSVLIRRGA